jgi:acyl-homoserine lactone acylase PvdQ
MKAKLRTVGIVLAALLLAMLLGILVTTADADGPQLWQEKCPTQHYEVRIEQVERGVRIVSCVRMAEEVER